MPRYFVHLHVGESRASCAQTGQQLLSPEAALEAAQRMARQLLAWNLEPARWLDCYVQVTDEADAVLFDLPLSEAGALEGSL